MLHLVGCLYYLYQWCTVNQIPNNEIYLLIKYIKSVHWRLAKRLSYIEEALCLKVSVSIILSFILTTMMSVIIPIRKYSYLGRITCSFFCYLYWELQAVCVRWLATKLVFQGRILQPLYVLDCQMSWEIMFHIGLRVSPS